MGVFTWRHRRREPEEPKDSVLSALFDFQSFAENPKLTALIQETERRFCTALPDEEMAEVSAAGELSHRKLSEGLEKHKNIEEF